MSICRPCPLVATRKARSAATWAAVARKRDGNSSGCGRLSPRKEVMRRRRTTPDENGLDWGQEDRSREDGRPFTVLQRVRKDVPWCLDAPPLVAFEHADELDSPQTPGSDSS